MKRKVLLLILPVIIFGTVRAQWADKKWSVGVHGGSAQYNGDLGNGIYSFDQAFYGFLGLSVSRYLSPHFDISLQGTRGEIGHVEEKGHFNQKMWQANLQARYSFFKYEDVTVRPYLFAGLGILYFEDKFSDKTYNNSALPVAGAGLAFKVSPTVYVQLQETFIYSDYDAVDGFTGGSKDMYMLHTLGLVFNIGKAKDEDQDGVIDRNDMCPGTPLGVTVDEKGCPVDTDLDGIPDYLDDCPQTPGLQEFKGCPDRDGDGIMDKDDACPDTPGLEEFSGCPDKDGDGIIDSEDDCPDIPGIPEFKGCPDRDGDQIPDELDACPDVPGIPELNGCPPIQEAHKVILEEAKYGIEFDFNKSTLKSSSYEILDKIVGILQENSHFKLLIEGHTDSKGSDEYNLKLSEERAASVEKYIESKGVGEDRVTSKGWGESKPVADNNTEEGRAKNRRVDLTVEY